MLERNEMYIARTLFKNKILVFDGQSFESFFTSVMIKSNHNFEQVKPYGNIGDRKNDGFDKTVGEYFQVYAPENIDKSATISNAVKKLKDDFQGLYDYWNDLCPIKKFNFVVNDKYKGVSPEVHTALLELSQNYPDIQFNVFGANTLEDICMSLDENSITEIVGCIVNPSIQLDFSALTDVINFLMNTQECNKRAEELQVADFNEKIAFNNLNDEIASLLKAASYQVGNLETFFRRNSEFAKSDIQKRITECYFTAANSIDKTEEHYSDLVFFKMHEDLCPKGTNAIKNAALVLISYYFELCDIFERPIKEENINDPS